MTDQLVLAVGSRTDTGLVREVNEDSLLAEAPVFVVADGMGGYEAGDRASAAVVDAFRGLVGTPWAEVADIRDALVGASRGVAEVAGDTSRGAGSTVTGAALVNHGGIPHWLVFNVGDSRVYRHVGSELEQLTVDHSLGQELVERGELRSDQLSTFENRNVITRAIGAADSAADSWLLPIVTGDRLLICSDGLYSEVPEEGIRATLTLSGAPESAAAALVQRARDAGGRDNITVIVVDVISGGASAEHADPTGARDDDTTTIPVRPA